MKLVTVAEMREIERSSDEAGLSYAEMMERAGEGLARVILDRSRSFPSDILVLVGPGNNGGDGLVAARLLAEAGCSVTAYLWKRPLSEADQGLRAAVRAGVMMHDYVQDPAMEALGAALRRCDVVVDALLGTGARGPLRDGAGEILGAVREIVVARGARRVPALRPVSAAWQASAASAPYIIAVDVPSGLDADTGEIDERALRADVCVSFGYPKRGQFRFPGAAYVGELVLVDIGTAPQLAAAVNTTLVQADDVARRLPARPLDAHKGTFGRVLIVAGSVNYVGAPVLAARAAYRSGAGLVTLAVPSPIAPSLATLLPEATYLPLPNDLGVLAPQAVPLIAERLNAYEALLIGPGITQEQPTRAFLEGLLEGQSSTVAKPIGFVAPRVTPRNPYALPPIVIDADALNILAGIDGWWRVLPPGTVLTPHPGEMLRLLGNDSLAEESDRVVLARAAADKWGCTLVLKGAYTVVASPGEATELIPIAEPALATAGTGDVLAGTVASFVAQGLASHEAAVCGAYLHALAGQHWAEAHGHAGMLASELSDEIPAALRAVLGGK